LIAKIETLFMIVHQKACVLATWFVSFGMARGIIVSRS
jgi:hypothetical protein